MSDYLLDSMDDVREICSLMQRIRKEANVPVRRPVLDFAFGGGPAILKEFIPIIAEDINVWRPEGSHRSIFADRDWYVGQETVKPQGDWKVLQGERYWVALNLISLHWLEEIGEERKVAREAILERKKGEFKAKELLGE